MKNLDVSSIFTRLREAANTATCEVASGVVARFASRVAVTLGDEFVERIASMSTRDQLGSLRDVLTRDQYLLVTELFDVLQAYALRSVTAQSRHHATSSTV